MSVSGVCLIGVEGVPAADRRDGRVEDVGVEVPSRGVLGDFEGAMLRRRVESRVGAL